ncbi:hypothetical protein CLOP_g10006 [Closterium sp. NIES-67]|nr:hypothetical protein CLOP_g10006 [Closterium sp. NIES-67]
MAQAAAAQALAEDLQSLAIGAGPGAGGADAVDYSALPRPAGVVVGGEDFAGGADGGEEALEGWGEGLVAGGLAEIEGNAHPRYFRMTCGAIPDSQSLRSRWHLPLGAVLQPLAPTPPGEEEVPVVNFGSSGIIRCRRCRTYVNPFVTFTDGGRRWRCNSCNLLNEVSHEYFCNLDSTGRRTDWHQRPELSRGSVEFVAPVEYMVRPPMPPTFFFLIDASVNNARSGVLQVISDAIRACLDSLPGDSRTRIGFLLFDSSLHFVSLKASLTQPHVLVSADIDDPFLPLPEDELLVNAHESRHVVEAFLDALPNLFATSTNVESAMGPALKAMSLLVSQLGGKVLLFQSTMPSLGAGRLRLRGDDPRLYGTDREHTVRCSEDAFYKSTAAEFSRAQICVDTFVFSSKYCDLASLGTLARYTGGQVYHYSGFHLANDGDKLRSQIVRNLTRETAWESVMRIRCSKGLKIATFHGHFFIRSSDLLAIPAADADKGYAVQISHEEAVLANQTMAYLQCALLYTSSCGERRIRVHTLAVPIVRDMAELYRRCDMGATATVLAKIALDKSLTSRLEECRQLIQNKTTLALREYRILTAGSAALSRTSGYGMPPPSPSNPYGPPQSHLHQPNLPQQRLVFPESLRLLPLYTLALCKSPALRGGFQEMGADARAAAAFELMVVSVGRTLRMLYPRLIRVDAMPAQCGVADESGIVTIPRAMPLATSSLDPQGAFLLDDSTGLTLWLGGALPAGTAAQIVGQDALNAPDINQVPFIPPPDSPLAARISAIVDALRSGDFPGGNGSRGGGEVCHQAVQLLRQGGSGELAFYHSFVEDRSATGMGYGEFVVHLARQVQVK